MQELSADLVDRLADVREPWCVSLYSDADTWLRRTPRTGPDAAHQVRAVLENLRGAGAPPDVVQERRHQLEQVAGGDGGEPLGPVTTVAVFATSDRVDVIPLPTPLPASVDVGDRFRVEPLIEAADELRPPVFVLAVSENRVRLIDATAQPPVEVEVRALPHDLRSTVPLDVSGDRNAWARAEIAVDADQRLREFARAIDLAVDPVLRAHDAWLIVAGAHPLADLVRASLRWDLVSAELLAGSHDERSVAEVARAAEPLIAHHREMVRSWHLQHLADAPRTHVVDERETARAALHQGAVDTLFVATTRARDETMPPPLRTSVDDLVREARRRRTPMVFVPDGILGPSGHITALLNRSAGTLVLPEAR